MKIEAYKCDKCNEIKEADEMNGLTHSADLFNKDVFTVEVKPEKSDTHFCLECYRCFVLVPAQNITNGGRTDAYKQIVKDYSKAFFTGIATAVRNRQFLKAQRAKKK